MKNTLIILLLLLTTMTMSKAQNATTRAAENILETKELKDVKLSWSDEYRLQWDYFPGQRKGVSLKEMSAGSREKVMDLIQTVLSPEGYRQTLDVIRLEGILGELENNPSYRDPDKYWLSIFGQPTRLDPWAFKFEGHHLSLNFTLLGDKISTTPAFWGANPAKVPRGPHKGMRILADEEDLARQLVTMLNKQQFEKALISGSAPADIITGRKREIELKSLSGLPVYEMDEPQQALLRQIIGLFVNNLEPSLQEQAWERLEKWGFRNIHFAWAGSVEPGKGHYYRIMGPTLLIEYDNTQNNANHIHVVYRDRKDDFGTDLLKEHYDKDH